MNNKIEKDSELKKLVEEERVNYVAAIAIRETREKQKISQAQLAKKIHTTQSVISRLEDGEHKGHSLKLLERIASALNQRLTIKC